MLSAKIKGLCRKIRARYVDLSAELTGHNTMDKDGVHYGEMGACVVSQQLAQVARRFLEGTVQRGVGGTASQSWKAPENLKRRYQYNREEQRTKPPFGFNDAHRKSHRTTAFRVLKPSRHSCRPDSRAHPYTKRPQQSFPQVRPYGNTVTDNHFPHPRDAQVRQQLPYPAVVNYTPTPGFEQQVRYVDSNIHLPPATGVPGLSPLRSTQAAHNNLAAFGWPPETPPTPPSAPDRFKRGTPGAFLGTLDLTKDSTCRPVVYTCGASPPPPRSACHRDRDGEPAAGLPLSTARGLKALSERGVRGKRANVRISSIKRKTKAT